MSADTEAQQQEMQREREHRVHNNQLQAAYQQEDEGKAEILRQLSEIDDLPIDPQDDPVMGQLISKLTSTANLTSEEVRSNEWVRQYILVLYLCRNPHPDGLSGYERAWAHDDMQAHRTPLDPDKRMMIETLVDSSSNLALSRSEDFKAVEESTRTVSESVMRDETKDESGGGGILGRFRS